jgi:hypothetical protein
MGEWHSGQSGSRSKVKLSLIHPLQSFRVQIHTAVFSSGMSSNGFLRKFMPIPPRIGYAQGCRGNIGEETGKLLLTVLRAVCANSLSPGFNPFTLQEPVSVQASPLLQASFGSVAN